MSLLLYNGVSTAGVNVHHDGEAPCRLGSEKASLEPDSNHEKETEIFESITDRPDGWLLHAWKAGDERAANVLFDRYAIRLVALVGSRLNRRFRGSMDPSEIVQSAMGSFFDAARQSRIQVSVSVSLWRLLATFARRKMARSIERQTALKRGGDRGRFALDDVQPQAASDNTSSANDQADEFLAILKAELPDDLVVIVEGVLAGQTQRELAETLGIDERTVRRRLSRVRNRLAPDAAITKDAARVARSTPTLPRVQYNQFVLGKLIGSGGFGKIYRASMQSDGRIVAVKFLRKAFWQSEGARRSFLREINIASKITHSGVIRYLGYGESPHGGPYVISEWIEGHSLQDVVDATPKRIVDLLLQVCEAIQAVHRAGLVHGDLTPTNVLVDAEDRVTITDFGFSQASSPSASEGFCGSQVLGGTLGFAAPEQIDPAFGSIGPKTDIYAIGGLLHWLLLKKPPNAGESLQEAMAVTLWDLKLGSSAISTVPEPFRRIMLNTLRTSPAERQLSLTDIIGELSAASNDV